MFRTTLTTLTVGVALLVGGESRATLIDTFESGPFSMSRTTPGDTAQNQTPNSTHCIAAQRQVSLHYYANATGTMSSTLTPLQDLDDKAYVTFPNGTGRVDFAYVGGPWDLTEAGTVNRVSLYAEAVSGTGASLGIYLQDASNDGVLVTQTLSVTGRYQFPLSSFAIDLTEVTRIELKIYGESGQTVAIRDISTTYASAYPLLCHVVEPLSFYTCGQPRSGGDALRWNWGLGTQVVTGPRLQVDGVFGPACTGVSFEATDTGEGSALGDMSLVNVLWQSATFDGAYFELRYTIDPSAPYVTELVGVPELEVAEDGFVITHEIHVEDVLGVPDGFVRQQLVVAPRPEQQISFDSVEVLPLAVDEGGYSLSFHVNANTVDPSVPILEMYLTGEYGDDAGTTEAGALDLDEPTFSLSAVPTISRSASRLVLSRPASRASSIDVFDVHGRLVRTLPLDAGAQSATWDGRSDADRPVASGVYLAHHVAPDGEVATARVVRLR